MYKFKYIICFFFFLFLFIFTIGLYKLYNYYQKQKIINEIIKEWIIRTNGNYKYANTYLYEGDYYLSINKLDDHDSHIQLITMYKNNKKYNPDKPNCPICDDLCYVVKKYDLHSNLYYINQNANPNDIVEEMIKNLILFNNLKN